MAVGTDASDPSPKLLPAWRAIEWLPEKKPWRWSLAGWFAELSEEHLHPTHEAANPKCLSLELEAQETFQFLTLDWAGCWHYLWDSYQKLKIHWQWIPSVLKVFGLGFDQAFSGEEDVWARAQTPQRWQRHDLLRRRHPLRLELGAFVYSSSYQPSRRPALCPSRKGVRDRAGLGFGGTWLDYIKANPCSCVELDELKELYKKRLDEKKNTRSYTSLIDSGIHTRHTTCTPKAKAAYIHLHWLASVTACA